MGLCFACICLWLENYPLFHRKSALKSCVNIRAGIGEDEQEQYKIHHKYTQSTIYDMIDKTLEGNGEYYSNMPTIPSIWPAEAG